MNMIRLDGAMGTELTRRGVDTALPLWSAIALDNAPDTVRQIHADYIAAGADILTANTFRTNTRALGKAGIAHRAHELTQRAVSLARDAACGRARVAGSIAPVEDCYTPDLVPTEAELAREHGELAAALASAGVDLMLVETMNTAREAAAACAAAHATGRPLWVSFTLGADNHLLSGESLAAAVAAVSRFAPEAVLVNCIPVAQCESALGVLSHALSAAGLAASTRFGAYGNVGHVDDAVGWTLTNAVTPEAYALAAQRWCALGASIIGGCCGTTPAHIAALASLAATQR
jgi:S-methylmethionine-dependent homocysteine/selenocysteine methylase